MPIAALTFAGIDWWWVAVLGLAIVLPLAWLALQPAGHRAGTLAVGLSLRTLGVGLLLLCLLDPQWTSHRPRPGANLLAIVADNSQGLQVIETGALQSRGQQLLAALSGKQSGWLAPLGEIFQLRTYSFDRDLRRVRDFSELDFRGERTDLGRALSKLRERFAGQPLAGVILLTDGNATDLTAGLPDLTGLPPIYPVVVGNPGATRDVRVERADVRQSAFDDAPVTLNVQVAGTREDGCEVAVTVTELSPKSPTAESSESTASAEKNLPGALPPRQTLALHGENASADATFAWHPRGAGVQFYNVAVDSGGAAKDEATLLNNHRAVMVDRGRPIYRILYVSGRPNWEYKFLNRALADDPQVQVIGLIRVAKREPKFDFKGKAGETNNPLFRGFGKSEEETTRYDQPVMVRINARDEAELRSGFPRTAVELFAYDAVIIDDLEAAFFTTEQLTLLRRFTAERGGGLLMLGGPDSLERGGYEQTVLSSALPFYLDRKPEEPPEGILTWKLTREGWVEPWVRVRSVETEERERLARMPGFKVLNPLTSVKPGATVLATVEDKNGRSFPALAAQNFGAGRVASVAVGDLWRWGLHGEGEQADLARFWRQLARWLVSDVPARVSVRVEPVTDEARVKLRVMARDEEFRLLESADVHVTLKRMAGSLPAANENGVLFSQVTVEAEPVADLPGTFEASFTPRDAGAYLVEADVNDSLGRPVGRAQAGWVSDPAAEEFRTLEPNRTLLTELARRTGGEVTAWSQLDRLMDKLQLRPAPIEETWSFPLWHRAEVFLMVLACFLTEWIWRRWRGLP